jgi:conjugal transfer pilus assembly protein TraV
MMARMKNVVLLAAIGILGAGCSTLSGLGGSSDFACAAPDGVSCSSLSGNYANSIAGNFPDGGNKKKSKDKDSTPSWQGSQITGKAPDSGNPLRTDTKVLRIWLAPWEDVEGDLHDQSYIYVVTNTGRWVVEHAQQNIINGYRPTTLVKAAGGSASSSSSANGGGTVMEQPRTTASTRILNGDGTPGMAGSSGQGGAPVFPAAPPPPSSDVSDDE